VRIKQTALLKFLRIAFCELKGWHYPAPRGDYCRKVLLIIQDELAKPRVRALMFSKFFR
jgi:hypothetical protein